MQKKHLQELTQIDLRPGTSPRKSLQPFKGQTFLWISKGRPPAIRSRYWWNLQGYWNLTHPPGHPQPKKIAPNSNLFRWLFFSEIRVKSVGFLAKRSPFIFSKSDLFKWWDDPSENRPSNTTPGLWSLKSLKFTQKEWHLTKVRAASFCPLWGRLVTI